MPLTNQRELNPAHIRRRFDRAASLYSNADFVQRHAAEGLLQRSLPIDMQPGRILDLGSALGAGSRQLAKQYRRARVVSIDTSAQMLVRARDKRGWFSRVREVQADALRLPLPSASFDLVFANMLLPFIDDVDGCLGEVARVLRKDGVFLFSTLGPTSLLELREAWAGIDDGPHVRNFADMHNLGDAVVAAGLRDPVLDVDNLCVTYRDTDALFRDLTAAGARNSLRARRQSLTGRGRLVRFRERLQADKQNSVLRLNLELVYGHAWGGGVVPAPGEFHLAPNDIGRRRR
jgi:malonyl-CoA O-methyltransferase